MTELELVETKTLNALMVFTEPDGLDAILKGIERKVSGIVPDISTVKGRKEIASIAYKVAQSKTLLDKLGAELTSDWKERAKKVDVSRKHARDFLDSLKDRVRQPLTEWEEAEAKRIADEEARIKYAAEYDDAITLNLLWDREKEIARKEAEIARIQAELDDKERKEKNRLEQEEKYKWIAERDAMRAAVEREMKLQAAKDADERRRLADIKELEDRIEAERKKVETAALAEAARVANQEHRFKIFNEILDDILVLGVEETMAKAIIKAIADGRISHVKVIF
ncbi:MAG: cell envelope biogenesis protein TolA [Deltaproteobacteria bacterium]